MKLDPILRQPEIVPVEVWHGKRQDISYLWPFGTTAYTHIPLDLNISKLQPRLVKATLLEYYDHEGYKLLDQTTGIIFRSCNVIFEEEYTYYTT